ncbi:MAG: hypothetical protein IKZ49_02820 [Alphaproteobacteria bacterium]|nr:hypothetical protein [Alphaproteobacteria bacterium]
MKKFVRNVSFIAFGVMTSASAFAEKSLTITGSANEGMCGLLTRLHNVFDILRIMAFIGAAFYIAGWAWGYIVNAGDKDKGGSVEDLKKKGISLIVGFTLLFVIGLVLSFIMSTAGMKVMGCSDILTNW